MCHITEIHLKKKIIFILNDDFDRRTLAKWYQRESHVLFSCFSFIDSLFGQCYRASLHNFQSCVLNTLALTHSRNGQWQSWMIKKFICKYKLFDCVNHKRSSCQENGWGWTLTIKTLFLVLRSFRAELLRCKLMMQRLVPMFILSTQSIKRQTQACNTIAQGQDTADLAVQKCLLLTSELKFRRNCQRRVCRKWAFWCRSFFPSGVSFPRCAAPCTHRVGKCFILLLVTLGNGFRPCGVLLLTELVHLESQERSMAASKSLRMGQEGHPWVEVGINYSSRLKRM